MFYQRYCSLQNAQRNAPFLLFAAVLFVSGCSSYQPNYAELNDAYTHNNAAEHGASLALPANAAVADLVAFAQQQHPLVVAARADVERTAAAITAAGGWMDPELSLSQGLNNTDSRTLALSQDIPVFQRRAMSIEQARANHRAAQARLTQVHADVGANVVTALAEYLYVQANLALQADLTLLREQFVAVAERQYAAGQAPMSDLLRAQNAYDEALSEQHNLRSLEVAQQARLNSALGREATAGLALNTELAALHETDAALPADSEELFAMLSERNATLLAAEYDLQALQVGRDVANTAGLPRLMVGVEYMDTAMESGTVNGMLSVSLPLWRSNYRAQQDAAAADLAGGQARYKASQIALEADLSMALYQWREADRNRQLYGDVLVTRAEQAVASILSEYANGNANYAEVAASQTEWISFALAYQRALANQLTAAASVKALVLTTAASGVAHEDF